MNTKQIYDTLIGYPNIWDLAKDAIPHLSNEEFENLKIEADSGSAEAQFLYGFLLLNKGEDYYKQGTKYFILAARQDEPLSCFILGQYYENGASKCGIDQDYRSAYDYFLKSGQKGYAPSEYCLGHFHEFIFLYQNYDLALSWYEKALNHGYEEARARLQWLKQTGDIAANVYSTNERLTYYFNRGIEI